MLASLDPMILVAIQSVIGGLAMIVLVGLVPEPARQTSMAAMIIFAHGLYWGGPHWPVELALILPGVVLGWIGLRWYPAIGLSWLVHVVLDWMHHEVGAPVIPGDPLSSFSCIIYDPVIAIWFFLGAPGLLDGRRARRSVADANGASLATGPVEGRT